MGWLFGRRHLWPALSAKGVCVSGGEAWAVLWSVMLRGELRWGMLSILSDVLRALWHRAARADLPTRPNRWPVTKLHFMRPCSRH